MVDVAGAVDSIGLIPPVGFVTHLGSFNAGDAGSLAVATLTNRALTMLGVLRKSETAKSSTVKGASATQCTKPLS